MLLRGGGRDTVCREGSESIPGIGYTFARLSLSILTNLAQSDTVDIIKGTLSKLCCYVELLCDIARVHKTGRDTTGLPPGHRDHSWRECHSGH